MTTADTADTAVPTATKIQGIFMDSGGSGLVALDTNTGTNFYDIQGLTWLIMESRKRGIPCTIFELAHQQLAALTARFNN